MLNTRAYSANVSFESEIASTVITLLAEDGENPSRNVAIGIAPDLGSNMFRFRVGEHDLIYCDPILLKQQDFTGNFVLWPLPNRVRDKKYTYQGQTYSLEAVRRPQGNAVLIHGFVFDQPWRYEAPVLEQDGVSVKTSIEITAESPFYEAYPFESRLSLTYTLTKNSVIVTYTVQNNGTKDMPFGFGLHPYFSPLSGRDDTWISIPAQYVMEADTDLLPTGRLFNVSDIMYAMFDLRKPLPLDSLKLDHVYMGLDKNEAAIIEYRKQRMKLRLSASEDFTHMVIYTPPPQGDSSYFCMENQTCSTDAVNLHHQGLNEIAHLLELHPGETSTGFIQYTVE
jgi:aldose 1-epimerase